MLKFKNRDMTTGEEWECRLSMEPVLHGVLARACKCHPGDEESVCYQVLLTPMDAACMAYELWISNYHGCSEVGHGEDCATMSVYEYRPDETDIIFVGGFSLSRVKVGKIEMTVPGFVVHALASALKGMMPQMMCTSTGRDEEEFG